ncbi:hypothetical protein BLNAU_11015 [Blattamonas nauphoetae]|uniref:Uncharacterized protein n=1 Tax=Blattamonas nauphoetae TaxID=2049346 RepID=A0ABQ9XNQ1_9EUKA|nr:hypothetical protein BLNAU_11015 [Blattamonas nauphoetae]
MITHLDELSTRCTIAESCGLVSVLSDIVSSHSSVGLRSIASSLLALIQTTLGLRDIQKTEHPHLNSHPKMSTMEQPTNDLNEQIVQLLSTMCNTTALIANHLGKMNERQMQFESIPRSVDELRKFNLLQQSRFQQLSKTGADSIEIYDEDFIIKTGNTFKLQYTPWNYRTNFVPKTLFSPIISSDVAQLTFIISNPYDGSHFGAVPAHFIDSGTQKDFFEEKTETAYWRRAVPNRIIATEYVLEADCRNGRRIFKLMMEGEVLRRVFVNLSLPFRFAITLLDSTVSVKIKSLSFTAKPTLKGEKQVCSYLN